MRKEELDELHYITLIDNVASILTKGILSHRLAEKVPHGSVAMQEVQDRRRNKKVPGGRMLHEYVNTYFSARNPMLYLLNFLLLSMLTCSSRRSDYDSAISGEHLRIRGANPC